MDRLEKVGYHRERPAGYGSRQLKVLFVRRTVLGEAGASFYFPALLAKLGHSVTAIALAGKHRSSLADTGVRIVEISKQESWLGSLRRIARSIRPDVVHVFLHTGCGLYPWIMRTTPRARFVLDIRSPLLRTGLIRWLSRLRNRLEVTGYDAVATHGIESGRTVIGNGKDMVWIPPGVDLSAVPVRHERRSSTPETRLVYVGSLDWRRRIEEMVKAVSLAAKDIALSLDIYGYNDNKGRITRLIEEQGMTRVMRMHAVIPQAELFDRLSEQDIGLAYVPRRLYDTGLPLKTLEYMACGLPVLATDTTGNRMVVQSRVNGLLVGGDAPSFAKGICELAKAPWLSAASENARRSVESFDWARIVSQRLVPLYYSLIEKG
jgi:glycosyltransferase involved in cell wall biosynthesis